MLFDIIKKNSEDETTYMDIEIIARQVGLDADSVDQFAIAQDSRLVLIDKSGRATYISGSGYAAALNLPEYEEDDEKEENEE